MFGFDTRAILLQACYNRPVSRGLMPLVLAPGVWPGSAVAIADSPAQSPVPDAGILAIGDFGVGGTIEQELGATMKRFESRIVVFHHPAWTCGEYRSNAAIVEKWVPLFEQYGVQLVLNGHDHNYQRFGPRGGVTYIVRGGGGSHLYPIESCPASNPTRRFARASHGFLFLRATDTALRVSAVNRRRHVIDSVVINP
jgi:Calcineurin-like phosphoesterase